MTDEPLDPAPPPSPVLASDAEREQAVARLRDAVVEGRLTLEEFSERVGAAQEARTDRDLAGLSRDLPAAAPAASPASAPQEHRAIFSRLDRSGPWALPAQSVWRALLGTIDLDLRRARLSASETRIEIRNVFSTVTIVVPEGVEVVVEGGGPFASQRVEAPTREPPPGAPRLVLWCHGPGGTLHVRPCPAPGLLERVRELAAPRSELRS